MAKKTSKAKSRDKRLARRAAEREAQKAIGAIKPVPPKQRAPMITFFLSRVTTMVEHKLKRIEEKGKPFRFDTVPLVLIRDMVEKKVKVRGKWVTVPEFSKWRIFHNAQPVREQDDTTSGSMFLGVVAPITAWVAAGLLDGLTIRDLPSVSEHEKAFGIKRKRAA